MQLLLAVHLHSRSLSAWFAAVAQPCSAQATALVLCRTTLFLALHSCVFIPSIVFYFTVTVKKSRDKPLCNER